jgi:hypothetical protein
LLLITIPKFYITGDGPSHTYNAKVFADYICNHNREFYKPFYEINRNLDPNWTAQIVMATVIKIVPYWLADKIFQILYVLVYALGFRYLMRSIHTNATIASLLFYPICFTLPFQMGFYNYSLALGILFYTIAIFIYYQKNKTNLQLLYFCISALLLALTHGMVATYGVVIIGIYMLLQTVYCIRLKKSFVDNINNHAAIVMALLPAIIVIVSFAMRQGVITSPHPLSTLEKLINFCKLYCCQSTSILEGVPTIMFGIGVTIIVIILMLKNNCINTIWRNTFVIMAAFSFVLYLQSPDTIGYAGGTDIRTAFLPIIFLLLACSCYSITQFLKKIIICFAVLIQFLFFIIRIPLVQGINTEAKQIVKIVEIVPTNAVVLSVQYNTHGSKNQFTIDNSMLHIFDYVGAMQNKNIINLNNYEADLNYFSLKWRSGMNPRLYMPNIINGKAPTAMQIENYQKQTNTKIDCIMVLQDTRKQKDAKMKQLPDRQQQLLLQYLDTTYQQISQQNNLGITIYQRK